MWGDFLQNQGEGSQVQVAMCKWAYLVYELHLSPQTVIGDLWSSLIYDFTKNS